MTDRPKPQPPAATPWPATAWALSDGKAGDEGQCIAVIEALGLVPDIRRVMPRPPFAWIMPWGGIDPREAASRPGSPIAPPWPDLVVASGRRAVPYLRAVKRLSGGRTFTVFLKDPRTGSGTADLIWVPAHDRLRGENVVVTVTSPHRMSPERLESARAAPDTRLANLTAPRAAVLVGGDSRHHRFTDADRMRFAEALERLAASGLSLMGTLSRRTPPALAAAMRDLFARHGGFLWDGTGPNPYASLLALADAVVVTADSVNMVGEAAATGRPILVFEPSGGHAKIRAFLDALRREGLVHAFTGSLEGEPYEPLNSTRVIADAILARAPRGP